MRRWIAFLLLTGVIASCDGGGSDGSTTATPGTQTLPASTSTMPKQESSTTTTSTTTTTKAIAEGGVLVTLVDRGVSEWWLAAEADSNGFPVVAYMTEDGSVQVLRCRDVSCENDVDQLKIGHTEDALEFDMALLRDGSPVVVVQSWGLNYATVHTCSDPSCSEFSVVELGDPEPCVYSDGRHCEFTVDFPRIAVGADGLVRVAYLTQTNPQQAKIATCQDQACGSGESSNGPPWEWSVVAQHLADTGSANPWSFRIDDNDRAVVGLWWEQGYDAQGASVTVCEDASCAGDPRLIFVVEGGVVPVTTQGTDDHFFVWYVTGAAGLPPELATPEALEQGYAAIPSIYSDYSDTMVASCDSDGCGEPQYVPPGEAWVQPLRFNPLFFTTDDGNPGVFFHHASRNQPIPQLHVTICDDRECSAGETHALGIAADERHYRAVDLITSPGTPIRVVYAANGAIHLYTCPDDICATR